VIGFDPRGIGATTPRTDCFSYPDGWPTAQTDNSTTGGGEDYLKGNFHRLLWLTAGRAIGNVNSTSGSLEMLDARAKGQAKLCQEKDAMYGKDSIFKYVNTPNVVRDMVSIIDAWDEWTESQSCTMHKSQEASDDEADGLDASLDTKGKLVYWGFSYGTLLGATFASMFPDRVGRVILDGVVDADHYVAPVWMDSIRDADTIFNSFPGYCHEAKGACAIYRAGDEIKDVEERFFGILDDLKDNPILLTDPTSKTPVIITYSDIRRICFSILYAPTYGFYSLAIIMDFILKGELQWIAQIFSIAFPFEIFPVCGEPGPAWMYPNEAQSSIMCSDKRYPLNETVPNLKEMFEKMSNISSFADVWLTGMLGCEGWGIEAIDPPMRWDDHPAHKQKPIKTSFPVLFISNTFDPVTPLRAGVDMAKKFVDAGLIEQKSMGHCSLAAVSLCTIRKIKAYFTKGEVPPPPKEGGKGKELEDGKWDRCEADEWPFHPYDGDLSIATSGVDAEDAEAMKAFKQLQDTFAQMKHWGQPEYLGTHLGYPGLP
jgi:pimeloyl-ACP methyl ester carboxylesterase